VSGPRGWAYSKIGWRHAWTTRDRRFRLVKLHRGEMGLPAKPRLRHDTNRTYNRPLHFWPRACHSSWMQNAWVLMDTETGRMWMRRLIADLLPIVAAQRKGPAPRVRGGAHESTFLGQNHGGNAPLP
jgi:hypothetical protein